MIFTVPDDLYLPSAEVDVNEVTVGAVVSTMKLELFATEMCARVALLPDASLIVPLFNARTFARMLMPSESVSPAWMVYWNTSVVPPLPEVYVAVRSVVPTSSVSCGVPVTDTFSLKVAVTDTTSPVFSRLF